MTKEESKALITLCVDEGVKQGVVKAHEFEEFLDFLDDCDKQHSLPSNLFEAKHAFSEERFPDEKMAPLRRAARIGYEAGAKWQKEQSLMESHKAWMDHKSSMIKQIEKAEWQGYDKGLADGTVLGKEQMMEEAVEGWIVGELRNQENEPYEIHAESDSLPLDGKFKNGDKVRVIILKKED